MGNIFKDIGSFLINKGLPFLGAAVGGPAGSSIAEGIANLLGVENTPDAIQAKIEADPQALVTLKGYEKEVALAQINKEEKEITATEDIVTTEAKSEDEYVRRTRPKILRQLFWLVTGETVALFGLYAWAPQSFKDAATFLLTAYEYSCGLLASGYLWYASKRTQEKTGTPGLIGTIITALQGVK